MNAFFQIPFHRLKVQTLLQTVVNKENKTNFKQKSFILYPSDSVMLKRLFFQVQSLGIHAGMDEILQRKQKIFNQLNFFGFISGLVIPLYGLFNDDQLPVLSWAVAISPSFISGLVLMMNYFQKVDWGTFIYFAFYPLVTSLLYVAKIDVGIELFFILYGAMSVFFINQIHRIFISIFISSTCYFVCFIFWGDYTYQLKQVNASFYFFNHALAIIFIFYVLYLIKNENYDYQRKLLMKNRALYLSNLEIQEQQAVIKEKATLLEQQAEDLSQSNKIKNKLISVISHDLRTPIYALKNLFTNVHQYNLSGSEIKELVPEVVNDLNATAGLMENLLQWAKSQMQKESFVCKEEDTAHLVKEILQLYRLQAETKNIQLTAALSNDAYCFYGNRDMIHLVLRNLVSNAIKFTSNNGAVKVIVKQQEEYVCFAVQDEGIGMDRTQIQQLLGNQYYTTKGTENESGTGLGLMMSMEFLSMHNTVLKIESEKGKGSCFSFLLPQYKPLKNPATVLMAG